MKKIKSISKNKLLVYRGRFLLLNQASFLRIQSDVLIINTFFEIKENAVLLEIGKSTKLVGFIAKA